MWTDFDVDGPVRLRGYTPHAQAWIRPYAQAWVHPYAEAWIHPYAQAWIHPYAQAWIQHGFGYKKVIVERNWPEIWKNNKKRFDKTEYLLRLIVK